MARIRTIKPEFPHSESMGRVSRDARLMFIMLWTIADDSGRTRGSSRMLASLLFPYDDDAATLADAWLDELEMEGCISRYVVDGSNYLQINNWLTHQKIDKPSASRFPEFANPLESSRGFVVGPRTKDLGPKDQRTKEASRVVSIVGVPVDGSLPPSGPLREFADKWNSTPGTVRIDALSIVIWKAIVECLNDPSWRWEACLKMFPVPYFGKAGCGITKFISAGFVDAVISKSMYQTEVRTDGSGNSGLSRGGQGNHAASAVHQSDIAKLAERLSRESAAEDSAPDAAGGAWE